MSRYAEFQNAEQYQVASNLGWTEFGNWVESLPAESVPELRRLWETGSSEEIPELTRQLEGAIRSNEPKADVWSTCRVLLEALRANQTAGGVTITT